MITRITPTRRAWESFGKADHDRADYLLLRLDSAASPGSRVTGTSGKCLSLCRSQNSLRQLTMTVTVPVVDVVTVSVAVTDWDPTVFKVTGNVWTPLSAALKVKSAGSTACGSLLMKCTVPA